jgi:fumarate hydratase class I
MAELKARGPRSRVEELRIELYDKVNALGIGAQGLGGLSTVLDVKVRTYPVHAANRPVAMIPNCAATRHAHFVLDGSGPAEFEAPKLSDWPAVTWKPDSSSKKVLLDTLTRDQVASWKPGERLLLSGKLLTGRDAAHKRIQDMLGRGEKLPVDFTNRVIYYVGPVDPVRGEVVGPAGPTTSTRMDKFTDTMLGKTGLIAMIGKAERGPAAIESIRRHKAAYLMAVAARRTWWPRLSASRACSPFRTSAWKRSTSSRCRTCRLRWRSTRTGRRSTAPVRRSGRRRSWS